MMIRTCCLLLLTGTFTVIGCEPSPSVSASKKVTSEDVSRDTNQAVKTATEYSRQTKDEFQKSLDARLKDLDIEIAKLREKGRELKDQAKVEWERKMAGLETKREAARVKLAEVGRSSAEAWKDIQKGAQAAWDEMDQAFREASREF